MGDICFNPSGSVGICYDPTNHITTSKVEISLADNEELIGVYGVKDKRAYFTSLGFIVKVKKNN